MQLTIHIDGGSRGNPGPAAAAVVVNDADSGKLIHEAGYYLGRATNNEAEYRGLLQAARVAADLGAESVEFVSDSELMVRQITGQYRVKSEDLRPLFDEAQRLLLKLDNWRIRHVRREHNHRADELVNLALDAGRDVVALAAEGTGEEVSAAGPANSADPAWVKVRLDADPGGACPAGVECDQWVNIGPRTPPGFCVYATKVVLDRILADPKGQAPANPHGKATCPHCRAPMTIEPAD